MMYFIARKSKRSEEEFFFEETVLSVALLLKEQFGEGLDSVDRLAHCCIRFRTRRRGEALALIFSSVTVTTW